MELGMIGLGKMGAFMTERLVKGGHDVVGYDRNPEAVELVVEKGARGADSLEELIEQLTNPKHVWVMIPAGGPTISTLEALADLLEPGCTVIDGGNSFYKDTKAMAAKLAGNGIHMVDVGTSGGIWGLARVTA